MDYKAHVWLIDTYKCITRNYSQKLALQRYSLHESWSAGRTHAKSNGCYNDPQLACVHQQGLHYSALSHRIERSCNRVKLQSQQIFVHYKAMTFQECQIAEGCHGCFCRQVSVLQMHRKDGHSAEAEEADLL